MIKQVTIGDQRRYNIALVVILISLVIVCENNPSWMPSDQSINTLGINLRNEYHGKTIYRYYNIVMRHTQ